MRKVKEHDNATDRDKKKLAWMQMGELMTEIKKENPKLNRYNLKDVI